MTYVVDQEEALAVLLVLREHVAFSLSLGDERARNFAKCLRAGTVGGTDLCKFDADTNGEMPGNLSALGEILCAFEIVALGGKLVMGSIVPSKGEKQPSTWMLRETSFILKDRDTLIDLAVIYSSVPFPSYRLGNIPIIKP